MYFYILFLKSLIHEWSCRYECVLNKIVLSWNVVIELYGSLQDSLDENYEELLMKGTHKICKPM